MTYSVVPIVEGHAETRSMPVLIRRIMHQQGYYNIRIEQPVRVKRYQVVKTGELERRVRLAMTRPSCRAIMIILDADDDCPKDLAPALLARAGCVASNVLISVVLVKRELEAWFIASLESLQGMRGIPINACSPTKPENIRDAKGFINSVMEGDRSYHEVTDQPAFAEKFDLRKTHVSCRSFRRFHKDLLFILSELNS